jgi:uncharacterized membrane protein
MNKPHFSKKEAVKFGFGLAKKNLLYFIGVYVTFILVSIFSSALRNIVSPQKEVLVYLLLYVVAYIINLIIAMGILKIGLEFVDGKKPPFKTLFYYKPLIKYFLGTLAQEIIVIVGFILLILPGIIFAIRLQYTPYLIVDKNLGPIEALKKSWSVTRGSTWNLFFFGILLALVNILGLVCLIIGLFVTVPTTMLANTSVYRKLLLQSKAS